MVRNSSTKNKFDCDRKFWFEWWFRIGYIETNIYAIRLFQVNLVTEVNTAAHWPYGWSNLSNHFC